MPRQVIGVIGALSEDTILITRRRLHHGTTVDAAHKTELGGRAANVAIAVSRSCRAKPPTDDGLLPEDHVDENDDEIPEVRMVAAVVDERRREEFSRWLRRNGVNADGVKIVEGEQTEQDRLTSIFDGELGRTQPINSKGVSQNWTVDHFDTIEKLGGGVRPDLVVLTMELHRDVVEHIINLASDEGVSVLVYAAPGSVLLADRYRQIEHLIGSDGDVAVILGYDTDELKVDVWPEMCEQLYSHKGIKNVVLKTGHFGAFFQNEDEEGFTSGYQRKDDVVDSSGSTPTFVGIYAAELVKQKDGWDIRAATEKANKGSAVCSTTVGYKNAVPWANELADFMLEALYDTIDDLKKRPKTKKSLPWQAKVAVPRGF